MRIDTLDAPARSASSVTLLLAAGLFASIVCLAMLTVALSIILPYLASATHRPSAASQAGHYTVPVLPHN